MMINTFASERQAAALTGSVVALAVAAAIVGLMWPMCSHAQPAPAAVAMPATAPAATLGAPEQRITDVAIHSDYHGYAAQQDAIKALNDTGRHRIASYSLAKAQCWLDVSFHEYTRNDRSAFPEEALQESIRITRYLAAGGAVDGPDNPALQTPLVNRAARLREDLWRTAAAARDSSGRICAAQLVACGEVELVHAGNEFNQQGWRHAKPYIQIAEDKIGDAQTAAAQCAPPAAPASPPTPSSASIVAAPLVATPPAGPAEIEASANVLFNFDRSDLANVRPLTRTTLDTLIGQIKAGKLGRIAAITISGHADRSNRTGQHDYNQRLSLKRAETIRAYLTQQGVHGVPVKLRALADSAPAVTSCTDGTQNHTSFEECLLPNRRVEVKVDGVRER